MDHTLPFRQWATLLSSGTGVLSLSPSSPGPVTGQPCQLSGSGSLRHYLVSIIHTSPASNAHEGPPITLARATLVRTLRKCDSRVPVTTRGRKDGMVGRTEGNPLKVLSVLCVQCHASVSGGCCGVDTGARPPWDLSQAVAAWHLSH